MTLDVRTTADGAGLVVVAGPQLSGAELLDLTRSLLDNAGTRDLTWAWFDLRAVTKADISSLELQATARLDAEVAGLAPAVAIAVVASRDDVFGLARMWGSFVAGMGWSTAAFRDRDAALDWLRQQVPDVVFPPEFDTDRPGRG